MRRWRMRCGTGGARMRTLNSSPKILGRVVFERWPQMKADLDQLYPVRIFRNLGSFFALLGFSIL
jgi:hypothetical protein